ncbi:diacylglycerol kinase [Subdoligranulum variabile]|uniref:Undecaprenol kinase n=1 Tax=Subdoligranulum variabile DSM 15176 TaxID=411471 RepID=D1PKM2_9FIRM|nr:diacylglycerol kinase [Subdoligranulum variabile]EFB76530.1 putative undecaprenol kinase [Subdoligranulum variabile DSM 15176]UWP68232.1 diacylglycerol kinase [Subdoligranulum variabile]
MKSEIKRFGRGFVYAWNGIRAAVQEERNFRFHLCAACYVVVFSVLAQLSAVEWALIALCIVAVLGMELMNSAVERAVDKPDTTHWWSAGAAKDMAAGAVLVVALGALVVGGCLLVPRLDRITQAFLDAPMIGGICLFALIPAYFFIFRYHSATQKGETTNGKTNS